MTIIVVMERVSTDAVKIAIASGKGGTGKTTLATNLAALIAEKQEIALVDLDVEEPNSGLFLKAEQVHEESLMKQVPQWDTDKCSLCGNCTKICQFHAVIQLGPSILIFPELCHSCYACSELCPEGALPMTGRKIGKLRESQAGKLHFIESRLDIGEEQAVPVIAYTRKYASKYDHLPITFYDVPPGTSCPLIEAIRDTDYVILVTEPTPFGLHDLSLAVETVRMLRIPFGVVLNRFGIGNEDVHEYCRHEDIPILACIPNDRRIAQLYSSGELVYRYVPEFRAALEPLCDFFLDHNKKVQDERDRDDIR